MRILLVSQYFWPESFLINDLAKTLVSQGHTIDVFTGKPNYPDGEVFSGYSSEGFSTEKFDQEITIYRVPLRPRKKGGAINLVLNYISFVVNGLMYSRKVIKNKSYDVVFVFMPSPITMVIPAIYLKWRLKAHLAVWVQDLWPESLSATGFVRNKLVLRLIGIMVRSIYFCTDTLLIQSEAFRGSVLKYSSGEKIVYYPNSCKDEYLPSDTQTNVSSELIKELENNFCLVFAGNLGTAQSLETLVQVAEKSKNLPNFKLVLVGSGSMLGWVEDQKANKGLDNILIAGRYPSKEMPQIYCRAAALLVTLKREQIFSYTIPSKIQTYLAAGRPILAAMDGEGARVINDANAGFTCAAEDAAGLSRCIEKLYNMPEEDRDKLGKAGRQYFLEHFEMNRQSQQLVEILEDRIKKARG